MSFRLLQTPQYTYKPTFNDYVSAYGRYSGSFASGIFLFTLLTAFNGFELSASVAAATAIVYAAAGIIFSVWTSNTRVVASDTMWALADTMSVHTLPMLIARDAGLWHMFQATFSTSPGVGGAWTMKFGLVALTVFITSIPIAIGVAYKFGVSVVDRAVVRTVYAPLSFGDVPIDTRNFVFPGCEAEYDLCRQSIPASTERSTLVSECWTDQWPCVFSFGIGKMIALGPVEKLAKTNASGPAAAIGTVQQQFAAAFTSGFPFSKIDGADVVSAEGRQLTAVATGGCIDSGSYNGSISAPNLFKNDPLFVAHRALNAKYDGCVSATLFLSPAVSATVCSNAKGGHEVTLSMISSAFMSECRFQMSLFGRQSNASLEPWTRAVTSQRLSEMVPLRLQDSMQRLLPLYGSLLQGIHDTSSGNWSGIDGIFSTQTSDYRGYWAMRLASMWVHFVRFFGATGEMLTYRTDAANATTPFFPSIPTKLPLVILNGSVVTLQRSTGRFADPHMYSDFRVRVKEGSVIVVEPWVFSTVLVIAFFSAFLPAVLVRYANHRGKVATGSLPWILPRITEEHVQRIRALRSLHGDKVEGLIRTAEEMKLPSY
ncbi:hypothetical protein BJ742DRAFT_782111 [Cladochytrium replicatum]|nr:hypothetical protein BJ742DRAFT_782111 [Cladochytrium replicatum]